MQVSDSDREIRRRKQRFTVPEGGKRHSALRDLRAWERNWTRWDGERGISARRLAELSLAGKARSYQFGEVDLALRQHAGLSRTEVEALGWVAAAQRGFGAKACVVKLDDFGALLGISARQAGNVVRRLVALEFLERRTHFRRYGVAGKRRHAQLACSYRLSKRSAVWFGAGVRRALRSRCSAIHPSAKRTPSIQSEALGSQTAGKKFQPRTRASDLPRIGEVGAANALARLERDMGNIRRAVELRAAQAERELVELEQRAMERRAAAEARGEDLNACPPRCQCGPCSERRMSRIWGDA